MVRSVRSLALLSLVLACGAAVVTAVGCAQSADDVDESLLPTEGVDAAVDAWTPKKDAAIDGARDVEIDSDAEEGNVEDDGGLADASTMKDASIDANPDASKEAGVDAGIDAGSDAGTDADAGEDAASDGGLPLEDAGGATEDASSPLAPKPAQGEVVITEVMYDPPGAEPASEWIEVYNAASSARSLSGLVLRDGSNRSHTIASGVIVAAGTYAVLASVRADVVAAKVPDDVIVYQYNAGAGTKLQLANSSTGSVRLLDGTTEIARADYGSFGMSSSSNGQSIQLKVLGYAAAGTKANWCYSANTWTAGSGKGTPGGASDCP